MHLLSCKEGDSEPYVQMGDYCTVLPTCASRHSCCSVEHLAALSALLNPEHMQHAEPASAAPRS